MAEGMSDRDYRGLVTASTPVQIEYVREHAVPDADATPDGATRAESVPRPGRRRDPGRTGLTVWPVGSFHQPQRAEATRGQQS